MIFGLDSVDAHQRDFMRFGAICPKWRASSEIGVKSFQLYYGHRAMQHTQFCAKSAKNDLKPANFLKRSFYFGMEGVIIYLTCNGIV
jgi:hypothetical protein